ncbi:hypothetical protein ACKS0A_11511 [Histoplasma ohiense]
MPRSDSSGRIRSTFSSKSMSPFSTHCRTATEVMNFVNDASHSGVSTENGPAPVKPKLLEYKMSPFYSDQYLVFHSK